MADPRSRRAAQAALLASADDTEAAFYEALQQGDIDRLMSLWAEDEEVACVHPGGPRLVGAAVIRAAFEAVFAGGEGLHVSLLQVRRVEGPGCAVHHVLEKVQRLDGEGLKTAYVLASNVYVRTAHGWRIVLHHASAGQQDEMQELIETSSVLH